MKGIVLLRKLPPILPRSSLLNICKSFIWPFLDYEDVIYDQPSDKSFLSRIESIQDNVAFAKTRAVRGSSHEKFYQELMLEHLNQKRWMRRLCLLYKFHSTEQPACIHDLLPPMRKSSGHPNTFNISFRREYFKNSFFRGVVSNCKKLYRDICDSTNYSIFRKSLRKFIRLVKRKP